MEEECSYALDVLNGAVKVCQKVEISCRYVGDSTIRLYGEYKGVYRQCLKAVIIASVASGNIPLALITAKKMMLIHSLEMN